MKLSTNKATGFDVGRVSLFLSAALLAGAAHAQLFIDGNQLNSWSQAAARVAQKNGSDKDFNDGYLYLGYLQGVVDASQDDVCLPPNFTIGQVKVIVNDFLKEHPEELTRTGGNVVLLALMKPFPCPPKKAVRRPAKAAGGNAGK